MIARTSPTLALERVIAVIPPDEFQTERVVIDALGAALSALPASSEHEPIALAFSGGLDSTVLLDAAVKVAGASRIVALHVHHGLSENADAWLAHCDATARALGVRFDAARVDVARMTGTGIEASARDVRYRALDAMCERHGATVLWLAQHADDQAETVLLQLLRGTGLAGLAAMAPQYRPQASRVTRMRPFLHLLRAQLERYAAHHGLRWIDDESNSDTRYARNALRRDVMPALAPHFPGFRDALGRAARHAAAAQRLLDALAEIDLRDAARADGRALSRSVLVALGDERGANLLRYWMRTLGLPGASAARLAEMMKQLRDAADTHSLRIDHAGRRLRLYRDDVCWEEPGDVAADEQASAAREDCVIAWRGEEVWHLPAWRGSYVFHPAMPDDEDAVPEAVLARAPLAVRSRTGGERIRPNAGGASRTLKNLFQERGVPAWQRDVPLLYAGDTLLFVPYVGANRAAEAAGDAGAGAYRRIEWRPDLLIA